MESLYYHPAVESECSLEPRRFGDGRDRLYGARKELF